MSTTPDDDKRMAEAIHEVETVMIQYQGFAESCRRMNQGEAASQWELRANAMNHAARILTSIRPVLKEVRATVTAARQSYSAVRGGHDGSGR